MFEIPNKDMYCLFVCAQIFLAQDRYVCIHKVFIYFCTLSSIFRFFSKTSLIFMVIEFNLILVPLNNLDVFVGILRCSVIFKLFR